MLDQVKSYRPSYIFFDCFDTVLHRNCSSEDILMEWAGIVQAKYMLKYSPAQLVKLRDNYFKKLTSIRVSPTLQEVCYKMFTTLSREMETSVEADEFIENCINIESNLEKKYIVADVKSIEVLKYARVNGIKCYVVSDFYLGKKYIKDYLNFLKISDYFDDIFVSCDLDNRKDHDGALFKYVCKTLNISPEKGMMIGDNYNSDVLNAEKAGIKAIYKAYDIKLPRHDERWVKEQLLEIEKRAADKNPLAIMGFCCYLFIERLFDYLLKENAQSVYFFSREGQFLKKLFDEFLRDKEVEISTHYIYVSRISTFKASLKCLEDEDFHIIRRQYPNLSIRSFLRNIGIESTDFYLGDMEIDKSIENFFESDEFELLKSNQRFREEYNRSRISSRKAFIEYFKSFGDDINSTKYIVDIGWKGTIQDNISTILDGTKIIGFYFGLSDFGDASCLNIKHGLLFEKYPVESDYYSSWSMLESYLFENIIQANHGQTIDYIFDKNGMAVPVMNTTINNGFSVVETILEDTFKVFISIGEVFKHSCVWECDVENLFNEIQDRLVFSYSRRKYSLLYKINMKSEEDSFGQFSCSNKTSFYQIARAIKHFGLWSNQVVDIILRSGNIWLVIIYMKTRKMLHRNKYEK